MTSIGVLKKMITYLSPGKKGSVKLANYKLPVGESLIEMNSLTRKIIRLRYEGEIHCLNCGQLTKKSFAQGYCYPCFIKIPETDVCVLRPELCEAHIGVSRDIKWSEAHCLQDHFVYLAVSSGLKVGVTRSSQIPTRWIDQGAWKAIKLAKTPNRHLAGIIEVELKKHMNDKTNWRHMLTGQIDRSVDLLHAKYEAASHLPGEMQDYVTVDDEQTEIDYPVISYPEKVKSINLDKDHEFEGVLAGIKGQYLMFEGGFVINIRKYGGYLLSVEV